MKRYLNSKILPYETVGGSLKMAHCAMSNPESRHSSPLHIACGFGRLDIVDFLISKKADLNAKDKGGLAPLHNATCYGHKNVVQKLVQFTQKNETGQILDINIQDNWGYTALHEAVASSADRFEIAIILLQYGADDKIKDFKMMTALDVLHSNLPPNMQNDSKTKQVLEGSYKFDELLEMSKFPDPAQHKIFSELVTPLNVNKKSTCVRKSSLLHRAAGYNNIEAIKTLFSQQADPNIRDAQNHTPLHNAAIFGHSEAVEILLHNKADPNLLNQFQKTPLAEAISNQKECCFLPLLDYGAQMSGMSYPDLEIQYKMEIHAKAFKLKHAIKSNDIHEAKMILAGCKTQSYEQDLLFVKDVETGLPILQLCQALNHDLFDFFVTRLQSSKVLCVCQNRNH